MSKVLIVSNPDDEHTKAVYKTLCEYPVEPILFYPEQLEETYWLSMDYATREKNPSFILTTPEGSHHAGEFISVWYRRPRLISLARYRLSHEARDFARDEWKTLLTNFYEFMESAVWVSHPRILQQAANKVLQLSLAKKIGFSIPDTLITSEAEAATDFIDKYSGRVIVKPTGQGCVFNENGDVVTYILTNRLSIADLDTFDDLQIAPVTFQQEINKSFELRVNVVGQEVLAIKIDSQKSEMSQVDWRRYDVENTPYTAFQLPGEIESYCLQICRALGLEFGAIDLICQPDGEFVFLEVNGNGQFLWAEFLSGVKVSAALACLLAGVSPALHSLDFTSLEATRNGKTLRASKEPVSISI